MEKRAAMNPNPFSPVFGGKPDLFFGRKEVLGRFDRALADRGSEDRAMFITGTRGCGKTALVEQLSLRARHEGWMSIDLGPEEALRALTRRLAGHDAITKTTDPQVSISVLGSGGSLGGISTSKTIHVDTSDLDLLLIDACAKHKKGVMVTIDEVQKLPQKDISAISNAFQMASRKGCDAILVVAGLPYSYEEVIAYPGCTFMRRAAHEKIGLLKKDEVVEAFARTLAREAGIKVSGDALQDLVSASYGHPYMMQLLGYYVVDEVNRQEQAASDVAEVTDVCGAIRQARDAYCARALRPMVAELTPSEREYLAAMAGALDAGRMADVSHIAEALGKTTKQTSMTRRALLRSGIVISPARGKLMFTIPYLADYLTTPESVVDESQLYRAWGV